MPIQVPSQATGELGLPVTGKSMNEPLGSYMYSCTVYAGTGTHFCTLLRLLHSSAPSAAFDCLWPSQIHQQSVETCREEAEGSRSVTSAHFWIN